MAHVVPQEGIQMIDPRRIIQVLDVCWKQNGVELIRGWIKNFRIIRAAVSRSDWWNRGW
jgi:hypothetical protein